MATSNQGGKGRNGDREQRLLNEAINATIPVFPYPPGLKPKHEPIWLETVNSKTADYWAVSDIPLLRVYCRVCVKIQELTDEIDEEGDVILNARENPVINPKIMVRAFEENRLMGLCSKLRLQPSSRLDATDSPAKGAKKKQAAASAAVMMADGDDLLGGAISGEMQ